MRCNWNKIKSHSKKIQKKPKQKANERPNTARELGLFLWSFSGWFWSFLEVWLLAGWVIKRAAAKQQWRIYMTAEVVAVAAEKGENNDWNYINTPPLTKPERASEPEWEWEWSHRGGRPSSERASWRLRFRVHCTLVSLRPSSPARAVSLFWPRALSFSVCQMATTCAELQLDSQTWLPLQLHAKDLASLFFFSWVSQTSSARRRMFGQLF